MKLQNLISNVWIVFIAYMLFSCTESDKTDEPSRDEKENALLEDLAYDVRGNWYVKKMIIATEGFINDPQEDSIVVNPGHITIEISQDVFDRYNQLNGNFFLRNEIIPFKSRLLANPELTGAFGLIERGYLPYKTSDEYPEEYQFLCDYFFGDNYGMILSEDGKTWIWKGFGGYIREMVLTR